MHTTMNCDFVEGEFFYSQPSSQGDNQPDMPSSDTLSWLPIPIPTPSPTPTPPPISTHPPSPNQGEPEPPVSDVGPPETVSGTVGSSNSNVQDEELSNTPLSTPFRDPEVNSSDVYVFFPENETNDDRKNVDEEEQENVGVDGDTGHYELPKRSTRGVPPRRYSPDWKGRKSRYSMTNLAQGQLTEMARAFEAALYEEEEIPQSFEEAMKHKHWREAMKKKIEALIKNGTWEKCTLPKGKKPVGCRWVFTIKR